MRGVVAFQKVPFRKYGGGDFFLDIISTRLIDPFRVAMRISLQAFGAGSRLEMLGVICDPILPRCIFWGIFHAAQRLLTLIFCVSFCRRVIELPISLLK